MQLSLLIADQGGLLNGALQGAIIGGIVGALAWAGIQVFRIFQKPPAGKDDLRKPPEEKNNK